MNTWVKNQLPDAWVDSGVHDGRIECSRSPEYAPFSKQLYVFINKRRNRLKILFWEDNGFCLYYKRLEQKQFHWPRHLDDEVVTLSGQQLNWLLDGLNIKYLMLDAPQKYTEIT